MVLPVVMYGCESWTVKKAERRRIDASELWCWRRLLRVPWTARRFNQSILKEISPGCSLEGMMLKLKFQYFRHLMQRVDSLEKTLMLGGIGGREAIDWCKIYWSPLCHHYTIQRLALCLQDPWIFILNDIVSACRKQCLLCLTNPWILLRCYFGQISDIINPYSGLLEDLVVNGFKRKTQLSLTCEQQNLHLPYCVFSVCLLYFYIELFVLVTAGRQMYRGLSPHKSVQLGALQFNLILTLSSQR